MRCQKLPRSETEHESVANLLQKRTLFTKLTFPELAAPPEVVAEVEAGFEEVAISSGQLNLETREGWDEGKRRFSWRRDRAAKALWEGKRGKWTGPDCNGKP